MGTRITRVRFKKHWSSGGGKVFRPEEVGEIFASTAEILEKRGFVEILVSDTACIETAMLNPAPEARTKRRGRPKGSKVVNGRVVMPPA